MEKNPVRANLYKNLDASLIKLSRDRAEVQKRLAKRASRLAGVDIGYSAFFIFETLSERAMRVTELAEALRLPASTVTRQVQGLESQRLIDRLPDEQDGRASIVKLSDEGMRVANVIGGLRIERLECALDGISLEDLQRVAISIERLTGVLREG
jgi:DNA-binding MarR family transcriptional regulator